MTYNSLTWLLHIDCKIIFRVKLILFAFKNWTLMRKCSNSANNCKQVS